MFNHILVQEWMTSPVVSVTAETPVRNAHRLMKSAGIRHLPVVADDKLVGIISYGDIRRASPSDATSLSVWELNYLWDQLTVDQAMTHSVITVKPDDTIVDALRLMLKHRFNSLPVVDANNHVLGIVTEADIFMMVIQLSERVPQP